MSSKKVKEDEMSVNDWIIASILGILCLIGLCMASIWITTGIGNAIAWFQNVDEKLGEIPYGFTCNIEEKNVAVGVSISCPKSGKAKCIHENIMQKRVHLYGCKNEDLFSSLFNQ